jgi:hypothetical protein
MSTVMTIEQFLLIALALIYIAISYGHPPEERSGDREDDMHQDTFHER